MEVGRGSSVTLYKNKHWILTVPPSVLNAQRIDEALWFRNICEYDAFLLWL